MSAQTELVKAYKDKLDDDFRDWWIALKAYRRARGAQQAALVPRLKGAWQRSQVSAALYRSAREELAGVTRLAEPEPEPESMYDVVDYQSAVNRLHVAVAKAENVEAYAAAHGITL